MLQLPELTPIIARALIVRQLSTDDGDDVDPTQIRQESADAFYLQVGKRLALICDMPAAPPMALCSALLNRCLTHGPRDVDLAVFTAAAQCGVTRIDETNLLAGYLARLKVNSDRQLMFRPILRRLGIGA